jgi:hypothetical protein
MIRRRYKKLLAGDFELSTLKAISLATSSDITRLNLTAVYCQKIEKKVEQGPGLEEKIESRFRLIGCDGHILVKKEIDSDFWKLLRFGIRKEFGAIIPEEIQEGGFFYSKASRRLSDRAIFEPMENLSGWNIPNFDSIIPKELNCDPKERPVFSFAIISRVESIFKALGIRKEYFLPKWEGRLKAAVCELEGGVLLLAMPCRTYEEDFV